MGRHEDYYRRLKQHEADERRRTYLIKATKPYSAFGMPVRMPWGCWVWIGATIAILGYLLLKFGHL